MLAAGILLAPSMAAAQDGIIAGRITEADGMPLAGANVVVEGTSFGDAAGNDGRYRIDGVPAGRYDVRASSVGFASAVRGVIVRAGAETALDFSLEPIMLRSEELVVTASRREQTAGGVAASISTISAGEIETRNAVALDDALRHVSGVQMAGNQVSIRGSSGFSYNTGSRVLLVIDGMPMLRPDADGIPFDAVPMHQVQRIEVLKGPGSALYGGGALGGVIHVITKRYPEAPETHLNVHGGAYQPVRYAIWRSKWEGGERPRPLGGFTLGHGRPLGRRSGIWTHLAYRFDAGHLNHSRIRSLQAFSKLTWRVTPDARFEVLAGANRRTSDHFLFWNGGRDALNPGRITFGASATGTGSDDNLINELSVQPSYTDIIAPNLLMSVRARLFGVLVQALDEERKPKPLSEGTAGLRYGGEVQLDFEPRPGRRMLAGMKADANATRSGFFEGGDRLSLPEGAAFVQWEEALAEGIDVTGGLRFDAYRMRTGHIERKLSPRAGAAWTMRPDWIARLAYGEGFRVPSLAERFIANSDYLPVVSNLDLKPETSRSFELGLRYVPRALILGFSMTADAAAFRSTYRRLVEPTFVPSEFAFQFVNLTRARVRGIEITAAMETPSDGAGIRLGYTFLDARDLSADEPLVFRSRHLLKVGATSEAGPIQIGADLRIASAPERVDSDFARFVPDAHLMGPTRVVDLRAGTSWRSVRVMLHLKNALDYYYLERPALLAPPRHAIVQIAASL